MLTRSRGKLKGNEVPKKEEELDQEGLEKAMVDTYRAMYNDEEGKRKAAVSFCLYRMNCWKGPGMAEKKRRKRKNVKEDNEGVDGVNLKGLLGRRNFEVGMGRYWWPHILSRSTPPRPPRGFCGGSREHVYYCRHEKVAIRHCKITGPSYPDDFIWMKNGRGLQHGTFVNGKRIADGERLMLFDGDCIGLGAPHDDSIEHWGGDKEGRGFVFKVKCLNRFEEQPDEDESSTRFAALNNVVILNHVLGYLSYDELKSARLVNKFWNEEAGRVFFSKTIVKLDNGEDGDEYGVFDYIWNNYKLPNLEINVREEEESVVEKYLKMLEGKGRLVRFLRLQIDFELTKEGKSVLEILSKFPNLETLDLILNNENTLPLLSSNFKSVNHLSIKTSESELTDEMYESIFWSAANLFPNVQRIFEVDVDVLRNGLQCFKRTPNPGLLFWTGVTEIFANFDDSSSHQKPEEVFQAIGNLPHKLTLLEILAIPSSIVPAALEAMLTKHAERLEHLSLTFAEQWDRDTSPVLRFPRFPKLKILELDFGLVGNDEETMLFQITFPSEPSICYENDLPEITKLNIMPWMAKEDRRETLFLRSIRDGENDEMYTDLKQVLDIFVPKDSETVSKKMVWVDFGLKEEMCKEDNPWFKDFVERFSKMFPNVHHPQVIKGLEMFNADGEGNEQ